jgi:hypothetical protein
MNCNKPCSSSRGISIGKIVVDVPLHETRAPVAGKRRANLPGALRGEGT